jgi:transcriptional regulator with XRE-family HTH domain
VQISSEAFLKAVKDVRLSTGLSQTEFGRLIGKTLSTVQRYEGQIPPRSADTLSVYARIASDRGRADLAQIMANAIMATLGPSVIQLLEPRITAEPAGPHEHYHQLLDYILEHGSEQDRIGIRRNLEWGAASVRANRPRTRPKAG